MEEENEGGWEEVHKLIPLLEPMKYIPKLPYPQSNKGHKMNLKFQDFLNIFRKLIINILFAKAL